MTMTAALAMSCATSVAAQDDMAPDIVILDRLAAEVPMQSWYPEGYYDLRIAAEAQISDYPRPQDILLTGPPDEPAGYFDLIACDTQRVPADTTDPLALRYGEVALEVARLRSEFARLGYPETVYGEPLRAYEKAMVRAAPDAKDHENSPRTALAEAIEAKRAQFAPERPPVVVRGHCVMARMREEAQRMETASVIPERNRLPPTVVLTTQPAGGEVLIINAFGFRVCQRKQPDPWDRFKCRWNEVETGVKQSFTGRYVYQVKWPDGMVRKGTREIIAGHPNDPASTVTFKKTGS